MNNPKPQTGAKSWVNARHEWSVERAFSQLHKQVEEDVRVRTNLPGGTPTISMKIVQGYKFFTVVTDSAKFNGNTYEPSDWVQFKWDDTGITIKNKEVKVTLRATPVITGELECKLKLESGEELSCSEYSRRALDKLFFG